MPSSPDTLQELLTGFVSRAWSTSLNLWFQAWLIVEVFVTRAKFLEPPGYCIVINFTFTFRTTIVFSCFRGVMAQFELGKHKFPN